MQAMTVENLKQEEDFDGLLSQINSKSYRLSTRNLARYINEVNLYLSIHASYLLFDLEENIEKLVKNYIVSSWLYTAVQSSQSDMRKAYSRHDAPTEARAALRSHAIPGDRHKVVRVGWNPLQSLCPSLLCSGLNLALHPNPIQQPSQLVY